jgi:molybdate transport system permease protein
VTALTSAEVQTLLLSLRVASVCVACTLVPGILVGWLLARKHFPGRSLLDAIVHVPLVLPPVVVGYVLLVTLGKQGILGGVVNDVFGMPLAFTWRAAVIASAVMGFPLLVRAVRLSVELVDARLEDAARTLGAPPLRVFRTITLPLALPGILTGAVLAFARSLGEFGATIIFAGNIAGETRTLPLSIFTLVQSPGGDAPAARLVALSLAISLLALAASEALAKRIHRKIGLR